MTKERAASRIRRIQAQIDQGGTEERLERLRCEMKEAVSIYRRAR